MSKVSNFFINVFFGCTELSDSNIIKTAGNMGSGVYGGLGVVSTMINVNKEVNVEPGQEMTQYAKDIHNMNYYKTQNQPYEVVSPNVKVFGNDETYRNLCENNYRAYKQTCDGLFINIDNKAWEELSDTDKELISSFMMEWDPRSTGSMKLTHSTDAANSF